MSRAADAMETSRRITDAVFELMAATDIPDIKVVDVIRQARVSKSTFYRHFSSVDDVVKRFEDEILEGMGRSTRSPSRPASTMRSSIPRPR